MNQPGEIAVPLPYAVNRDLPLRKRFELYMFLNPGPSIVQNDMKWAVAKWMFDHYGASQISHMIPEHQLDSSNKPDLVVLRKSDEPPVSVLEIIEAEVEHYDTVGEKRIPFEEVRVKIPYSTPKEARRAIRFLEKTDGVNVGAIRKLRASVSKDVFLRQKTTGELGFRVKRPTSELNDYLEGIRDAGIDFVSETTLQNKARRLSEFVGPTQFGGVSCYGTLNLAIRERDTEKFASDIKKHHLPVTNLYITNSGAYKDGNVLEKVDEVLDVRRVGPKFKLEQHQAYLPAPIS